MSGFEWGAEVEKALGSVSDTGDYREALAQLEGFAVALATYLGGTSRVTVEAGFLTNLGQQFRMHVQVPSRSFQENLFRAYIPVDGFPVTLEFSDAETAETRDVVQLRDAIVDFLRRPAIGTRLAALRDLNSQSA